MYEYVTIILQNNKRTDTFLTNIIIFDRKTKKSCLYVVSYKHDFYLLAHISKLINSVFNRRMSGE